MLSFIETAEFRKGWDRLGLDDDDYARLQEMIEENPNVGDVIPGSGGARKVRLALPGRGKSGGSRVVYATILSHGVVLFLDIYAKSERSNLDRSQLKQLGEIIAELKDDIG